MPTFSVSFRLQRTTTEAAFVSVPVTDDCLLVQPNGAKRLDAAAMARRALDMAAAESTTWQVEERHVVLHPIQDPPPDLADRPCVFDQPER